jgi:heme A synthase
MFGRMMNETLGKMHFFLTFIFLNGTFFTMHILGAGGFPRRLADPYHYETFRQLLPLNQFMTICAIGMGRRNRSSPSTLSTACSSEPRRPQSLAANSLEWMAPSPPGHGNFDFQPVVYRGPYESIRLLAPADGPWLKWAALATLALVIFQGFLGGARVLLDERFVALAHGVTAPVFIAALAVQAVFTSQPSPNRLAKADEPTFRAWTRAILLTAVLCYAQMTLGAWVRHTPATAPVGQFRAAVLLHLALAVGLTLQSVLLFARAWAQPFSAAQRGLASLLAAFILLQVTAGASTWVLKYGWPDGFESWRWAAEHLTIERSLAQSLLTNVHVMFGYGLLVLLSAWTCSAVRWAGLYSAPGAFMILAARSAG